MSVTRIVIRKPVVPHLTALAERWGYEDIGEVVNLLVANAALSAKGECPAVSIGITSPQALPVFQSEAKPVEAKTEAVSDFGIDLGSYSLG